MCCSTDDICGPFAAEVGEWRSSAGIDVFRVETSGADGARTVFRRYNDFAALARELGLARELPPRSFLRKRLLAGFMERRRAGLQALLGRALAGDAHACSSALRSFLGLPELQDCFGETEGSFCISTFDDGCSDASGDALLDHDLYTIAEGPHEKSNTFLAEPSW